jgi:hypothetical protein
VFSLRDVRAALTQALRCADEEDYAGTQDGDGALFALTVDEDGILIEDTVEFSSCAWATGRLHRPGPGAPGWLDGFDEVTDKCEQALYRLLARPVSYLPSLPGETRDWRPAVVETLGAAAAGAVTALIGALAPVIGGAVGAGALAGAAGSIISRAAQRVEHGAAKPGPPAPTPSVAGPATNGSRRQLQVPDLVAFAAHILDIFGLPAGLVNPVTLELRVESSPVWRKQDGSLPEPAGVFLTSPVAADLARIKQASRLGPALATYLRSSEDRERRTDLRNDREAVLGGVRPDAFPLARWPADISKPLVVGQQFAVNTILADLDSEGLFSVNGPPGTGKTTLLRDLIAAIVLQRAMALADLPSPEAAFTTKRSWTTPDGNRRTVQVPRRELTGFEIVVASSNNNAVENVTRELPALDAIGADWRPEAAYFAEQAEAFLGARAWGMVAAPLGNAEKRRRFKEKFWWGPRGMHALLQSLERAPAPVADWVAAVDQFKKALDEAADLVAERTAADTALRFPVDDAQLRLAQKEAGIAARQLQQAQASLGRANGDLTRLRQAIDALRQRMNEHEGARPRGLRGLLGVGKDTAAWQQRSKELLAQNAYRSQQERNAVLEVDRLTSIAAAARQRSGEAARDAEVTTSRRAEGEQRIRLARETWGAAFPAGWTGLGEDQQELTAPWADEEWTTARTRVFLAALDLHRALVAGVAGTFRRNLLQLIAALIREPGAPPPGAERAAWQTLFLLVPVISTTFASCGRMFRHLGRESIGWVLVDEAGQALPQDAVGVLWRAKRAVVVGDPLQLEPISQVPGEVQDRLRQVYDVEREWLPATTSAQGLADRSNRWGTYIGQGRRDGATEDVWVGAPLRVHRRCEQPMFDVSNTIAYRGLMVYGTREASFPGAPHPTYPPSSWIDVTGPSHGKWVAAQGHALVGILQKLHVQNDVSLTRIYVLSPFRDVVQGCKRSIRNGLSDHDVAAFARDHVGTVHTMQGKEADVVLLILGTDPRPAKRARDWAAQPVNLLNVAVSRARRRLFVIGDLREWRGAPNFCELAEILPHHQWRAAGDLLP